MWGQILQGLAGQWKEFDIYSELNDKSLERFEQMHDMV